MLIIAHALTIHSMCNIHVRGYLIVIIDPSSTLESERYANLILIDEMSMMINIVYVELNSV